VALMAKLGARHRFALAFGAYNAKIEEAEKRVSNASVTS